MKNTKMKNNHYFHYTLRIAWKYVKKILSYLSYIRYFMIRPRLKPSKNSIPITVSFTTYPARVKWLPIVIGSIVRQSRQPDRIVLYLSNEQFSNTSCPELKSIEKQGVELKFVDGDLRSHKKYFYALREYSEDIVITIDDDIIYEKNMVEDLFQSYLRHLSAVSAKRVHEITFNIDKKPNTYREWEIDTKKLVDTESFELMATGCGGVLYPPHCLDKRFCDATVISSTCLYADDLWLKIMELLKGTPVVLAKARNYKLKHVWNTECDGLALENVGGKGNDDQLKSICDHYNIDLFSLMRQCE